MLALSLRNLVRNAAAVFSGRYGAVTRQAEQAGCSRQTVYNQARRLEQRLQTPAPEPPPPSAPEPPAGPCVLLDRDKLKELATVAFAMGLSLRQIEDLLGRLLPEGEVPDHSTLGHWVQAEARRAGEVLKALDPACADRVEALAIDEIFFGGDRPSSRSSRRA
jgi:hypothetical protein